MKLAFSVLVLTRKWMHLIRLNGLHVLDGSGKWRGEMRNYIRADT